MRALWSKRMSPNDDAHRSATTGVTSSDHARLWVIGLSALLIALGFARRRPGDAGPATGDRRSLETGRGRSAETPSQIPARGWKDILLRVYHGISDNRILGRRWRHVLLAPCYFPRHRGSDFDIRPLCRPGYRSRSSRYDCERRPRWGG